MKQPPDGFNPPDFSGQTKILFVNEGNPTAMLMTNTKGRRNLGGMRMPTAMAALDWCRKNSVMMVYLPVRAEAN